MDKRLEQLVEKLKKAYGERLVSVVLYGSAAAGDHHAGFSDFNILCVLTALTPRELAAAAEPFRWWREQGSPAPLLITEHELATSADCFAIEFHDMQSHHQLLYGKDVIPPLVVENTFYRAQVEHDLRAKLMRLRQKASGMLADQNLLRRLLLDSVSTFCVLFRHALLLHGVEVPPQKREVVRLAAERFAIDAAPFERLLDVREARVKPKEMDPLIVLAAYLRAIDTVIDAVDRLEK
jgi:hypothetical protein